MWRPVANYRNCVTCGDRSQVHDIWHGVQSWQTAIIYMHSLYLLTYSIYVTYIAEAEKLRMS